jgi:hypothetical protein
MDERPRVTQIAVGTNIALAADGGTAIVNVYAAAEPRALDPEELARALEQLASLPDDDRLPDLSSVSSGSRMSLHRNPLFVGRHEELRTLGRALKTGRIAAVTGLGGNGKTQLATECVHRYGQYFAGGVFWVSFADSRAVAGEIAACGGVGHLDLRPDFSHLTLDDQTRAVRTAWASPLPRLLVFDNCEDPQLLATWAPPHGSGARVLMTSRRAEWPRAQDVEVVPLKELSQEHSVTLLRLYVDRVDESTSDLAAIADELGNLPLALHLAGSVMARYRHLLSPAAYLEKLRTPGLLTSRWLQSDEISPTQHVQQIASTFSISYERLTAGDPTDDLARLLWHRAAHFAHGEPIPQTLLLSTAGLSESDQDGVFRAEDAQPACPVRWANISPIWGTTPVLESPTSERSLSANHGWVRRIP